MKSVDYFVRTAILESSNNHVYDSTGISVADLVNPVRDNVSDSVADTIWDDILTHAKIWSNHEIS